MSGDRDGVAMLWDVQSGASLRRLEGHGGHVTVASVDDSSGVYYTGAQVREEEDQTRSQERCLASNPSGLSRKSRLSRHL